MFYFVLKEENGKTWQFRKEPIEVMWKQVAMIASRLYKKKKGVAHIQPSKYDDEQIQNLSEYSENEIARIP